MSWGLNKEVLSRIDSYVQILVFIHNLCGAENIEKSTTEPSKPMINQWISMYSNKLTECHYIQ